jgi:hypothetical protein
VNETASSYGPFLSGSSQVVTIARKGNRGLLPGPRWCLKHTNPYRMKRVPKEGMPQ